MLTSESIEPGCMETLKDVDPSNLDPAHAAGVCSLSIAISLKRIADALTKTGPAGNYSAFDAIQRWCYENCQ